MPVGATLVTWNSGPKLSLTSPIFPISADGEVEVCAAEVQAVSQHTQPIASAALIIVVNLPNAGGSTA
jgi:hypothetical protein